MKKIFIAAAFFYLLNSCVAQTYSNKINQYRQAYKKEFITDKNSPLKGADTGYFRFFAADKNYIITADFAATPDAKAFEIATHSGKTKPYRRYGILRFKIHDTLVHLEVYQSLNLLKDKNYREYLFIPFNDMTNYVTTYAGGRYLDIQMNDIKNNKVVLDFNKCYNPYCAYAEGYSCPIPPDANKLKVAIAAGEMMFGKQEK